VRLVRDRFPHRVLPPSLGLPRPTPVEPWPRLSRALGAEVWAKRDDLTHPAAGGNKVRKLDLHLAAALAAGAAAVATVGPAGSNHVLATVRLARLQGLRAIAVLFPQPPTPRAVATARAIAAEADELHPAPGFSAAIRALAAIGTRPGVHAIPPGGSTPAGTLGHVEVALELARSVEAGELPRPRRVFLPLGTASTAAGLAVGLGAAGLGDVRVTGVLAGGPPALARVAAAAMTEGARELLGLPPARPPEVDTTRVGPGYSRETAESRAALARLGEDEGLPLDPTYAAKALAALLAAARAGEPGPFLFVVTCPPQGPVDDPDPAHLPPPVRALFR
jgi:D-cysteine desulfhydrase